MVQPGNVTKALRHAVTENRWLVLIVIGHTGIAMAISAHFGLPYANRIFSPLLHLLTLLTPVYLLVLLVWTVVGIARRRPRVRPIAALTQEILSLLRDLPRLMSGSVALVAMVSFFQSFSYIKSTIPDVNAFAWDRTLADLDRVLHGGLDPFHLLMPILGTPLATTAVNAAYHFWLFLLYFFVFVACFTRTNPDARRTFLIAFTLVWGLGGNLAATVFSSAGPCYYALLGLGEQFQPLMQTLRGFQDTSPVWAIHVQDMLWAGHTSGSTMRGISAFPSMHVASSTLMMLYAFTWRRWAGWAMTGFLAVIMAGSVHLGWHYAVDGYAGAALTFACWHVTRKIFVPRTPQMGRGRTQPATA